MSFTLGEVAKRLNISKDTIRYYEKEGLLPKIRRNEKGYRVFSESDIDWIFLIRALRDTDMSISKIKEYILLLKNDGEIRNRKEILEEHKMYIKNKITTYHNLLQLLDKKLNYYDQVLNDDNLQCLDFEDEWKNFREELNNK